MKEEIIEQNGKKYKVLEIIEEKLYFGKYTISNIKDALKDEDWNIRLEAYRVLGFTKDAFKDKHWYIRSEAYRVLGITKDAFKDEYSSIRLQAYRALGFTKDALKDENHLIRLKAKLYFEIKEKTK